MITIGCFHAHYSNIALVEETLAPYEVELVHYVDPGLIVLNMTLTFQRSSFTRR